MVSIGEVLARKSLSGKITRSVEQKARLTKAPIKESVKQELATRSPGTITVGGRTYKISSGGSGKSGSRVSSSTPKAMTVQPQQIKQIQSIANKKVNVSGQKIALKDFGFDRQQRTAILRRNDGTIVFRANGKTIREIPPKIARPLTTVKIKEFDIKKVNNVNLQAGLTKVTRSDLGNALNVNVGIPKPVVIPPNYLRAANYKGLGRVGANLAKKGFGVPSEIVFGFQAGVKDWKSALAGFVAGAGFQAVNSLGRKGLGGKVKLLGKAAGKLAGPIGVGLLLFDAGKQYRKLKAAGNSDAFAITKVITTLGGTVGGAAVGAGAVSAATSASTRNAIASSARKTVGDIKKPTKKSYQKISRFLDDVNPVKPYKELVLEPSSLKGAKIIKKIDPKTKKEITTIINKLESIIKFGNAHIKVIKKAPPKKVKVTVGVKGRVAPLPKDLSLVPVTPREINSGVNVAKSYLIAYKQMLDAAKIARRKPKFSAAQNKAFEKELRKLMSQAARNKKLAKGLQVKASRPKKLRDVGLGAKAPRYEFKELITGKKLQFTNRKSFLKAVKEQEKLIRSGAINVKTKSFADWFKAVNNQLTSKDGKELKIIISKARKKPVDEISKRIFTLQDVAKKTSVKKTPSGGVEVKTGRGGQVVVLETPKTVTKNKPALKQLQKQALKQKTVTKLKVGNKQVVIVKPATLRKVVSTGLTLSQVSKLGAGIASALTKAQKKKLSLTPAQKKFILPIFEKAQVPGQLQSPIKISKQAKDQIKKQISRQIKKTGKTSAQAKKPVVRQGKAVKQKVKTRSRATTKKVKKPVVVKKQKKDKKVKKYPGYFAYAFDRGKPVRINDKPVSMTVAKSLAAKAVENSTSATGYIRGTNKKAVKMTNGNFLKKNIKKFKIGTQKKRKNRTFITEKNRYRINTVGEKKGITAKGWVASRNKRLANLKKARKAKKRKGREVRK